MSRPKLAVEEVFILDEVIPYDGSSVVGVFTSLEAAQEARPDVKRWYQHPEEPGEWASRDVLGTENYKTFYVITSHTVRSK